MGDTLCAVLTDSIYSGNCIGSCHDLSIILRESRPFFRLSKRHLFLSLPFTVASVGPRDVSCSETFNI